MNYLNLCNAVERTMYEAILLPKESLNSNRHNELKQLGLLHKDIREASAAIADLFEKSVTNPFVTSLQRYLINRELAEIDYIQVAEIFALRCDFHFKDWEESEQALRDIIMLRKGAKVNLRNELKK